MFPINNSSFQLFQKALDSTALRQNVIANNIANNDTPQFKRSDVVFEELLQQELDVMSTSLEGRRTNSRHIPIGRQALTAPDPQIRIDENTTVNNNMNNVDIDYENALLAKNQLKYNVLVTQLNHEFRSIRTALDGRR